MKISYVLLTIALLAGLQGASRTWAIHESPALVNLELTVAEPANVGRTNDRVTTGIPIPQSATGANWALFDGATEIPLQTEILPGVRTPWLLLDFQSTQAANETKIYTLRQQAPTATSSAALDIVTTATETTIDTGPLKAVIGRTTFNLFDEVWFDANANGAFEAGEQLIAPTTNDNLQLTEGTNSGSVPGTTKTGRGMPTSFGWETLGPLRATLKVEGAYGDPADPLLNYTVRMTFMAGRTDVLVEHLIRNSFELEERYVKVQSAKLVVGGNAASIRSPRAGHVSWTQVGSGGATLETIPPELEISTAYEPALGDPIVARTNAIIDVDDNGGMIVGDWSYHDTSVVFNFDSTLNSGAQAAAAADRLVALAPAAWYSDRGAFGAEHFSTLEDEIASYDRWGWEWPVPNKPLSNPPYIPRVKSTYRMDWNTVDSTLGLEADELWMNILMYIRTRSRGYLDRTDIVARYWKYEYAWRSDGFLYLQDDYWSGPDRADPFTPSTIPSGSSTTYDQNYIDHNIRYGKDDGNHTWNGGLIDYYYLFGDKEALTAAIDFAERARQYNEWITPGTVAGDIAGNPRGPARTMHELLRTWEATADPQWKTATDHVLARFLQALSYDPRGFHYALADNTPEYGINTRYPGAKVLGTFQEATVTVPLYRYWVLTGNAAVRQRLLEMANFALTQGVDHGGYTGDRLVIDWPTPGAINHMTFSELTSDTPTTTYSLASTSATFIDSLIIGYRLTGNQAYFNQAKYLWGKASRRLGGQPYTNLLANEQQVGRWLNSIYSGYPYETMFSDIGDLMSAQYLFYEAVRIDDTAPAAVIDLQVQ